MKKSAKMEIEMSELTEKRRYGLILRAVEIGLVDVGIKDVSFSLAEVKDGNFVFMVERE